VDCDLEAESASSKLECSHIEFGWPHVTSGVVGSPYALARDSEEVRIELAVGILVVKHRNSVGAWCDPRKLADGFPFRYRRNNMRHGLLTFLWKAVRCRIEGAGNLPLVVTHPHNFDVDDVPLRSLGLLPAVFRRHQEECAQRKRRQLAWHYRRNLAGWNNFIIGHVKLC